MHAILAAGWLALVSPVVSPGGIHHARFVTFVSGARECLREGSHIDWQIPARGKRERKLLERLIATAEWDNWKVTETGNRLMFVPPATAELAKVKNAQLKFFLVLVFVF